MGLGYKGVAGVCDFLSSVLSQQKFEATDVKALDVSQLSERPYLNSRTDCATALGQISVTALCYS